MKTPWLFLIALSVMVTMWMLSVGAVATADASLFEKLSWPVVSGWAALYVLRAAARRALAPEQPTPPQDS